MKTPSISPLMLNAANTEVELRAALGTTSRLRPPLLLINSGSESSLSLPQTIFLSAFALTTPLPLLQLLKRSLWPGVKGTEIGCGGVDVLFSHLYHSHQHSIHHTLEGMGMGMEQGQGAKRIGRAAGPEVRLRGERKTYTLVHEVAEDITQERDTDGDNAQSEHWGVANGHFASLSLVFSGCTG